MFEQNQLLRAAGNRTAMSLVPPLAVNLDAVDVSANYLWINGLFFTCLSLSLATALLSVLAKQWLQAYTSLPTGNAMERVKIRQFRYEGFEKWRVPEIIGALPLILHASLALFLVGLSLYVAELYRPLCWIVVAITGISFLVYLGSILIPAITIQCPYRITLLFIPVQYMLWSLKLAIYLVRKSLSKIFSIQMSFQWPDFSQKSIRDTETAFLDPQYEENRSRHTLLPSFNRHHSILANSLSWLQSLQSNYSIQQIAAQTLHGIFWENHWMMM
jgi:hypothetical protein